MSRRFYTNSAATATLSASVNATDTTIPLAGFVGFPTSFPYTATISWNETDQEVVLVTGSSPTSVTVQRAYDGTSAQPHAASATFDMTPVGKDFDEANSHIQAIAGAHGITGNFVGTSDAQDLTNKTLTSPTVTTPTITTPTVSGGTLTTPTLSGPKLTDYASTSAAASALGSFLGKGVVASIAGSLYSYDGTYWNRLWREDGGEETITLSLGSGQYHQPHTLGVVPVRAKVQLVGNPNIAGTGPYIAYVANYTASEIEIYFGQWDSNGNWKHAADGQSVEFDWEVKA